MNRREFHVSIVKFDGLFELVKLFEVLCGVFVSFLSAFVATVEPVTFVSFGGGLSADVFCIETNKKNKMEKWGK